MPCRFRSSQSIVAWINFTSVIPWLDHGMTQWVLPVHATMPPCNDGSCIHAIKLPQE
ncbi:hypothetical protein [Rickettsia monacensis]|uniref:hypothetical protein n=1 Tax=Rickettsia monacensis TaxID=109232 RepID=UPI0012FDE330|nr:hypothetical protein [Rickettsia monacensis]